MKNVLAVALWFALLAHPMAGQAPSATQSRVVFLTDHGFEPKEVTVKPGPVNFIVRTQLLGRPEIELWELTPARAEFRSTPDAKRRSVMRERLVLTPGSYELRDQRFSKWRCLIRVQP